MKKTKKKSSKVFVVVVDDDDDEKEISTLKWFSVHLLTMSRGDGKNVCSTNGKASFPSLRCSWRR